MKNNVFKLCDQIINPGEHASLALPLPEMFSCAPICMPIKVIHGKSQGPCLLILAAMHGDELNGTEIINRILNLSILKKLKGTIIAIPVVNVFGLINRSRYLPGGINFDTCFPGSADGSHASRMAHLLTNEVLTHADFCVNLETGFLNYSNLPQIHINFDSHIEREMAEAFNAPVISNCRVPENSLRATVLKRETPMLTYRAGEAMRFNEEAIRNGVIGVLNLLRSREMLPNKKNKKEKAKCFFTNRTEWIRASTSGISQSDIGLGAMIEKNEVLCRIEDPFGVSTARIIRSPCNGVVIGVNTLPLIHEGEALLQIAEFDEAKVVAPYLETWEGAQQGNESSAENS